VVRRVVLDGNKNFNNGFFSYVGKWHLFTSSLKLSPQNRISQYLTKQVFSCSMIHLTHFNGWHYFLSWFFLYA